MDTPDGVSDCHVAEFESATVLEEFQALFERVLDRGGASGEAPATVPLACAKLLACRCEENAAHEMAIFARNPVTQQVIVSLPLTKNFEAVPLPFGALRVSAPPAPMEYVVTFQSETACENTLGCLRRFTVVTRSREARWRAANPEAAAAADAALIMAAAGADPAAAGADPAVAGAGDTLAAGSAPHGGGGGADTAATLNQFGQRSVPVVRRGASAGGGRGGGDSLQPNRVGLTISRPTDARRMAHVQFNAESQTFAGVPRELEGDFARIAFNLPLSRVTCVSVPGYESNIPLVLVLLREYFLKRDGHVETGIFRIAPDKGACDAAKRAVCLENRVDLEEVLSPHIFANLIKQWFRDLPGGLLNELGVEAISRAAEEGLPEDPQLSVLPKLSAQRRAIFLWLLDTMALPVLNEEVTKMGAKNMAIVVSVNLWLTDMQADPMSSLVFSQQLSKFLEAMLEWRMQTQPVSRAFHFSTVKAPEEAVPGDRVEVSRIDGSKCRGTVKYVGECNGKSGAFVGVALDDAVGFNDGCQADGTRYFQCKAKHGLFVRLMRIRVLRGWEVEADQAGAPLCSHGNGPECPQCGTPRVSPVWSGDGGASASGSTNASGSGIGIGSGGGGGGDGCGGGGGGGGGGEEVGGERGGGEGGGAKKVTGPEYFRVCEEEFAATGVDMSNTGYLSRVDSDDVWRRGVEREEASGGGDSSKDGGHINVTGKGQ